MKPRSIIPLVIGLGVGFFAIKMGIDMVQRAKGEQGNKKQVMIAGGSIGAATRISGAMLSTKSVPEELIPQNCFTDPKALVGRVSKMTIPSGVVVSEAMLAPNGAQPGLSAKIPGGYRAVSVKVNEASAVAGFVMPGAHVDVFASERNRKSGRFTSREILTDVEVGAVGQSLSEVDQDGKTVRMTKSVTLFLKPEQVPVLHVGSTMGALQLALRSADDTVDENPVWSNLFAKALAKKPAPKDTPKPVMLASAHPKIHVVEVVRGPAVEHLEFDETGKLYHPEPEAAAVHAPAPAPQAEPAIEDYSGEAME